MTPKIYKFVDINLYKTDGKYTFPRQEYGFRIGVNEVGASLPLKELIAIENDECIIEVEATFMGAHIEDDVVFVEYHFQEVAYTPKED